MKRGLTLVLGLALLFCSSPAPALPGPAPFVAFKAGLPEETDYIEVALVADAPQMAACGSAAACAQLMDQIASHANQILQSAELSPRLRIVVVKQLMLSDTTFSATAVSEISADEALLYAFSDWAMGALDGDLDVAILITAEALSTSDLGITTLNGACRAAHNYAVIRGGNLSVDKSAEILVHELGHLMGMRHDGIDNDCPAEGALMRAAGTAESLKNPRFSACSQEEFAAFSTTPITAHVFVICRIRLSVTCAGTAFVPVTKRATAAIPWTALGLIRVVKRRHVS